MHAPSAPAAIAPVPLRPNPSVFCCVFLVRATRCCSRLDGGRERACVWSSWPTEPRRRAAVLCIGTFRAVSGGLGDRDLDLTPNQNEQGSELDRKSVV